MPLIASYALAFNTLLWTARFALESWLPGHASATRWGVILLAPCALLAAFVRVYGDKRTAAGFVSVLSVLIFGLVA